MKSLRKYDSVIEDCSKIDKNLAIKIVDEFALFFKYMKLNVLTQEKKKRFSSEILYTLKDVNLSVDFSFGFKFIDVSFLRDVKNIETYSLDNVPDGVREENEMKPRDISKYVECFEKLINSEAYASTLYTAKTIADKDTIATVESQELFDKIKNLKRK